MTYLELIRDADKQLDNGKITLGEYENMIKPLEQQMQPEIIQCKDCRYYSIKYKLCKVNLLKPKNRYICNMPQNGFCSKAGRRTDGS